MFANTNEIIERTYELENLVQKLSNENARLKTLIEELQQDSRRPQQGIPLIRSQNHVQASASTTDSVGGHHYGG